MKFDLKHRLLRALRAHSALSRVSILPTVWSNCVAAWALSGSGSFAKLGVMIAALSLLFVGGSYLNDACDTDFDSTHHPDRPIPSGAVGRTAASVLGTGFIIWGLILTRYGGWFALGMGSVLAATIVAYDFLHHKLPWSPLLLAAARCLTYFTVAVGAGNGLDPMVVAWGLALAAYTAGPSFLSRVEQGSVWKRYLPLLLVFIPLVLHNQGGLTATGTVLSAIYLAWMAYCLFFVLIPGRVRLDKTIGGFTAGICLVDLFAVSRVTDPLLWQVACIGLFIATVFAQGLVPRGGKSGGAKA
ncbi:hypothetical protein IIC65_06905 [Candidatus Sumerlaeota bacterium]|nr:hypothetical protein [Candidatus Sumerlaeota bacterium]